MTKRVIVVDQVDTHFRTIREIRNVETYAFSSPKIAIDAARVLRPDLFVVGDPTRTFEIDRFCADLRTDDELRAVPVLILTAGTDCADPAPEAKSVDATEGVDGPPPFLRIDPDQLRAQLRRILDAAGSPSRIPAKQYGGDTERLARHCDSLSRIALMRSVDDDHYIEAVLREAAESLRDDVGFAAALVELDGSDWAVDAAYAAGRATVSLPERGSRMALGRATAAEVLRKGTMLLAREEFGLAGELNAARPWKSVVAAPVVCDTTVYIMFLAAGECSRDSFDAHDRAYVEALVSLCGARIRQRDQLVMLRSHTEHDALTGILNRTGLRARVTAALRAAETGGKVALAVLDVDRFNEVNETLGHHKGDTLIVEIADALAKLGSDGSILARLGGDAFGILFTGVSDRADLERRVARYSERFALPFGTGDHHGVERVHLGASIGVACAPDDADNFEELLARADSAMFAAKEAARGRWWFFDPAVEASFDCARRLRTDLANALVGEDFVLHFQPIVDLVSGAVVGAEALIRWNHPQRGLLMPFEFVPFAEENGLLRSVGAWVIREAAAAARRLVQIDRNFRVWINLSPTELTNPALGRQLAECGSLQRSLGIEMRQTSALRSLGGELASLSALKRAGLQIAIDDFGTGTLPLRELKYFPIDVVKLDRSFISGLPHERRDRDIVEAVLELGARFGFTTLAKGIETSEHARAVRDAGCNRGQGYYFGRPMPLGDIAELLRTRAAAIKCRTEIVRGNLTYQSKVV